MAHQREALARMDGKRNFALFMEMGCGKTWTALADAERCFMAGKIDAVLVAAPKGVHLNWVKREIPTHLEVDSVTYAWRGPLKTKKAKDGYEKLFQRKPSQRENPPMPIFAINIDAFNTDAGRDAVDDFLSAYRTMFILDESIRIKSPTAQRTKHVIKLGRKAEARRILSGAPITKDPMDLFCQFDFLKSGLIGTTSYRAFKSEYAVLLEPSHPKMQAILRKTGGRGGIPQVVATDDDGMPLFKNLDKLYNIITPHMFRVRKEDCLDLPPKVYQRVYFELTPAQRRIYTKLEQEYEVLINQLTEDGSIQEAVLSMEAIAARTRMRQVTSGYVQANGELMQMPDGDNPRLDVLNDLLDTIGDHPCIIWAYKQPEIRAISELLKKREASFREYHGDTSDADRELAIDEFQSGKVQYFLGNPEAAGIGLTLTRANVAVYYSNSENNDHRMQSEDRCHRIGTTGDWVTYYDILAEDSIDEDTLKNLYYKRVIAKDTIDRDKANPYREGE